MSTENNPKETKTEKRKKLEKFLQQAGFVTDILAFISSVLAVAGTLFSGIGTNLLSDWLLNGAVSEYIPFITVIFSIIVGLTIVFFIALRAYKQQQKRKIIISEELKVIENDFFRDLDISVAEVLSSEV